MKSYHTDLKRVKTKTKSKRIKNFELLRETEMERQCEEFYLSLECKNVDCEPHEKNEECITLTPWEEEQMEHDFTFFEPFFFCVETQVEEFDISESKDVAEVKKIESLNVSYQNGARGTDLGVVMLLCSCEECVQEINHHWFCEVLGLKFGQVLAMDKGEEQRGSSQIMVNNDYYIVPCSETQKSYVVMSSYFDVKEIILGGKIYNLLTPHFHYNMLLRLMVGLVDINVALSLFKWENGMLSLHLHRGHVVEFCYDVLMLKASIGLDYLRMNPMIGMSLEETPDDSENIRLSQWMKTFLARNRASIFETFLDHVSCMFKWLIMMAIDKGEFYQQKWGTEIVTTRCVDEKRAQRMSNHEMQRAGIESLNFFEGLIEWMIAWAKFE